MAITASGHQLFDSLHGLLTCALLPDCFSRNNGNRYEACFSQHELRSSRHDGCVATVSHRQPPMRGSTSSASSSSRLLVFRRLNVHVPANVAPSSSGFRLIANTSATERHTLGCTSHNMPPFAWHQADPGSSPVNLNVAVPLDICEPLFL